MAYKIKEAGKNGTVEMNGARIVRTIRKTIGRDDVQTIPISSVTHVDLDRRTLGADSLTVHVGTNAFTWRTKRAEELAERILSLRE